MHTLGLYSAFLAWRAIFFKSSLHPRFTVDTIFLEKKINSPLKMLHCSKQNYKDRKEILFDTRRKSM